MTVGPLIGVAVAAGWAIVRVAPRVPYPGSFFSSEPWPFPSADVVQSYGRSSPTGPVLIFALGLEQSPWLVVLRLCIAALAVALLACWVYTTIDDASQRTRGVRLIVLAPVTAILFTILGSYDPFTVIGLALLLYAWRRSSLPLLTAAGVYLGIQHFEQALVGVLALGLLVAAMRGHLPSRLTNVRNVTWALPGLVLGKIALSMALLLQGVSATDGRAYYLTNASYLKQALVGAFNFGPVLLLSLFAGLWAVVLLAATMLRGRKSQLLAAGSFGLLVITALVTLDHTRVFAITSAAWLAVVIASVLSRPHRPTLRRPLIVVEGMAWLVPPLVVQGVDRIYVDPMNVLDHWIMFIYGYILPLAG